MNNGKESLSAALGRTHNAIINSLQVAEDRAVADRLENFYNKVIYNKEMISSNDSIGIVLDKYLTEDLAITIQKALKIPLNPKFTWQSLEKTIGDISQKAINNIFQKRSKLSMAQSGTGQTFVPILDQIPEEYKDEILKELSIVQDGENSRTYARMGKNDVFITAELKPHMEEELALLSNLSLSIKNYSGTIKLEAVNPLKAYLAIMQNYRNELGNINLFEAYMKYYKTGELKTDPNVTLHLNHIMNIYGLTGMGNIDLHTGKQVGATRFLVVNTGRNIRVYSTAEMIQDLIQGGMKTFLFDSKSARKKNQRRILTVKKYSS